MEAQAQTPPAIEALASKLQADSGESATTILDDGYSHNRSEHKFRIQVLGKQQILNSLFSAPDVSILGVSARRSGAVVRTSISVKVATQTPLAA